MIVFETERLIIKGLEPVDKVYFTELLTNPEILKLIPQIPFTENQILNRFNKNLNLKVSQLYHEKCVLGIFEKHNPNLIGLSLFLMKADNTHELGYRFRVKYWGKGYATETTKGMLDYYFKVMQVDKVMADANIANSGSIKILEKFMSPIKEFFNERDQCTDRRYQINKHDYLKD
ncbi:GNAT family N-acetyltransferase [Formosa sp. L2A11]|uniref:GNAT family N-acetyltransferase n=1 Tax=Formosa sp. L2A11 TaxID=2686363 RepID=UPI00131AAFEA|nr:GNAT family N-acetyltransferase [Formosa sp. L2A11]